LFVVMAEPSAEDEDEFNHWYDDIHGPDALENGSFTGLRRYKAAGPGWRQARYLALWEGHYDSEPEAWAYISPLAHQLREAGRVTDISSVVWAAMLMRVPMPGDGRADTSTITTVQNDWRAPDATPEARAWLADSGVEKLLGELPHASHACYTSDAAGRGAGYHLVLVESAVSPAAAVATWSGIGAEGASPTPPYTTIFGTTEGGVEDDAGQPARAPAWVMHWDLFSEMQI
jgi:hypothetical protein